MEGVGTRGPIAVSPTGQTIGSTVCTVSGCRTQIASLLSGDVVTIHDQYLRWLSDTHALLNEGTKLRAYRLKSQSVAWEIGDEADSRDFYRSYFLDDGTLLLSWHHGVDDESWRYELSRIDVSSGDRETIESFAGELAFGVGLESDFSTERFAVLVVDWPIEGALQEGGGIFVFDLTSHQLREFVSPFSVSAP